MFIQKCFIRKNSEDLRKRLELIGKQNLCYIHDEILITHSERQYSLLDLDGSIGMLLEDGFIDCGTNEELFLAIAALRDDSDIHQWFIHQDCSFLKCECDSKIDMWGDYEYPQEVYPRKATVEELIKHFTV